MKLTWLINEKTVGLLMDYCDKFKESFSSYVEGELASDTRQVLESHLSICPECRDTVQRLNALRKTLNQLSRISTSPDFDYQLNQRLQQRENQKGTKFPLNYFHNWKIPAISFAFILVAFSFFIFYGTDPGDVNIGEPDRSSISTSPIPAPKDQPAANEENLESAQGGAVSTPPDSAAEELKKKVKNNMKLVNKKSFDK